jgi:hypothetical protein
MKKQSVRKQLATLAVATLGLLTTAASLAQPLTEIPRTPSGKPDFSGIWQAITSADWDIEPHVAAYGQVPERFGALTAVPPGLGIVEGGEIPYTEVASRVRDENRANTLERDPLAACYMPGVPRANYLPFPFQIVQSTDVILIAYEFAESNRILYVDQPELESQVDAWMGHSNAHWEGDTLVVRVTGQMPDTWFDRAGNHHSYEMVVEERWTYASPNHINYEATITDPQTFTRPWKLSLPIYRRIEPNMQLLEFKCAEFAEEYLYGEFRKPGTTRAGARPENDQ